jgi:outer membrane receptor for ferrienterochelin and colicin
MAVDESYRFENNVKTSLRGLEAQITLGPWFGLHSHMSISIMETTDSREEDRLDWPSFWITTAIGWQHAFFQGDLDVHLGIGIRHWTGFWTLTGETSDDAAKIYCDPDFLLDLKAAVIFIRNVELSLAVDNVLDKEILFISGFTRAGRTMRLGLMWNLFD